MKTGAGVHDQAATTDRRVTEAGPSILNMSSNQQEDDHDDDDDDKQGDGDDKHGDGDDEGKDDNVNIDVNVSEEQNTNGTCR